MDKMPVMFIGHGSPINAIEDNPFTQVWGKISRSIYRPKAIVCISAHWYTRGQSVSGTQSPDTIHDFYGFPEELYKIRYKAPGAPKLAKSIAQLISGVELDVERGLDHGAWSVLGVMYPQADIPVCQLSVNAALTPEESYRTGKQLRFLRNEGVLILGSGNIVHNLSMMDWELKNGYPWADSFDSFIQDAIVEGRHKDVLAFHTHPASDKAFRTRDHFDPLLYVLGAVETQESVKVINDTRIMGSISMTSYIWG